MDNRKYFLKLLDDYYGESRSEEFKNEIADFLETYSEDMKDFYKKLNHGINHGK